jgi:hypothetical protein
MSFDLRCGGLGVCGGEMSPFSSRITGGVIVIAAEIGGLVKTR